MSQRYIFLSACVISWGVYFPSSFFSSIRHCGWQRTGAIIPISLSKKKAGEIRSSLLLLFLSQALFLAIACGLLKKTYLLVAATASWGLGDIAAAWVGRPLGKHKISLFFADPNKAWEGSAAMAIVSFLACFISLHLFSPYSTVQILLISLLTGIVSSLSEMASKGGMDTVTVPFANLMVLALISSII